MKTYRLGVIPGDGTGPEVVREGLKVLEAVSKSQVFLTLLFFIPLEENIILKQEKLYPIRLLKNSSN